MFFFSALMYRIKLISHFNRGQRYLQIDTSHYYFLHSHISVNLHFHLSFSVFFCFILCSLSRKNDVRSNSNSYLSLLYLSFIFPSYIPNVDSNNRICLRRCVVCSSHQIRTRTSYICTECDAPLCVPICFKDYHTKLHY